MNGSDTTTGGSIIMPIDISTDATTMSMMRKGRKIRKPISNARRTTTNEARSRRDRRNRPTIELVDATADDAPLAAAAEARAAFMAAATAKAAEGPQKFVEPAAAGVERLTINYRRVRVSDGPDEVNTRELGRLDRGDEVEVLGSYEGFLEIVAPDGLPGWIPRLSIV